MYTHEVSSCGPYTAMVHYRESANESGLISIQEIGHTVAVTAEEAERRLSSGLVLPDAQDIMMNDALRTEPSSGLRAPEQQIRCSDLDEFVRLGRERWEELVKSLGSITKIRLDLMEKREVVENRTVSGLIIPDEEPEVIFKGYVAKPIEIEALERLANSVPISSAADEAPVSQLYL